ncbi:MAG TPA: hypothetical protein P5558_20820 [Geminicoccaceae bacterium]|nr:hypothetical protein [Geminicoccaceae bacterium]
MPEERARSLTLLLTGLALLAGLSWLLNAHQPEIVAALRQTTGLLVAMALHILALVVVMLLGLRLTVLLWRHPVRRRTGGAAGLLFLLSLCLVIYQAANAGAYLLASRDLYAITLATDASPDATMRPLPSGNLLITGTLGPGLMRDFLAAEAAFGPFAAVEISSPGGLVVHALELARHVERHGLTVIVRDECLSACVPIALASPRAYAEKDAVFGFHRVSTPVELHSDMAGYTLEVTQIEMADFLRRHRVPESLLEEAARHGADTLHLVSARDMVEMGLISGTLMGSPGS